MRFDDVADLRDPVLLAGLLFDDDFFEPLFTDDLLPPRADAPDDLLPPFFDPAAALRDPPDDDADFFEDDAVFFEPDFALAPDRAFEDDFRPPVAFREPPEPLDADARETSLLNRLPSSSERISASRSRSNHSKNSSHSISSSVSSPEKPGKSMRRIPGSFPLPVALTRAGRPPRSSTQLRITS